MEKINPNYQKNVDALIPTAETFANSQIQLSDYENIEDYYQAWNHVFHIKMNELAEVYGRVKIFCPHPPYLANEAANGQMTQ